MTAHDAPERLSGYAKLCIALLVALGFSLGCSEFIVIGIQPEIARNYDVALSQTGLLMSAFSITYAIATPVLALGTGRLARRALLIGYSALFCLGNAAAALAVSFEMLIAARVLIGFVSGALLAVGVTYIPDEGQWKNNMAEGEGTLRTTDGSVYTGHFSRGREDGEGTLLTKDGTRFEGFFKQGKKDGPFVEMDSNGNVIRKGTFKNGRLLEEKK